jgi:glycosyltransferase involved in cell wall biosynthesis
LEKIVSPSMSIILTIAIPTYNRSRNLDQLLRALSVELASLEKDVEILVSDNASSDQTAEVTERFSTDHPKARIVRNSANIGAEANVVQCFEMSRGRYVWLMGDDDMPKSGTLRKIVALLEDQEPDLVHLSSEWLTEVSSPGQGSPLSELICQTLDPPSFARAVNVWVTFISGMIINKETWLTLGSLDARSFLGTNLPQLGWVLPVLSRGSKLIDVQSACVLATGGNTGGYAVLRTFGINLPRVVATMFGRNSSEFRNIIGPTVRGYLPQLAWNVRFGGQDRFLAEDPWHEMRQELGEFAAFWTMLQPVGRAPKPIARAALLLSRAVTKAHRLLGSA